MKKLNIRDIILISLLIIINFIGAFIALTFRLPIFLDSIGTIASSFLFGPIIGALTGVMTSLINGFTFDPVSLYFTPVQLIVGLISGILYKKALFKKYKGILGLLILAVASSIVGAIIATFVFEGITSSGITYVVLALKSAGASVFTSVLSTQFLFDIFDKGISVMLAIIIINKIPNDIKLKINLKN